jgi:hypothetical protein
MGKKMAKTPKWDKEIVSLVARVKFARAAQIAKRFDMSVRNANMRLTRLQAAGLLRVENRLPGGRLFAATRDGIGFSRLDLHSAQFSYASIEHDLAIADFVVSCEALGYATLAEREMAAEARATGGRMFATKYFHQGTTVTHLPDAAFLVRDDGDYIAIEIELSNKSIRRTESVMSSFHHRMDEQGLIGVLYLAGGACSVNRLSRIADSWGDDRIAVTKFDGEIPANALKSLFQEAQRHKAEERRRIAEQRKIAKRHKEQERQWTEGRWDTLRSHA